jgi:hypothetical protein
MRRIIIAVGLFAPMLAYAQETDDAASKVTALARHISEMRDLLQTTDVTVRDAAIETALHDPSPAIRGMAIYYALRRYDHLPLDFALPAGSAVPATELPSLVLSRVEWSADGRSLKASGAPCGGYVVTGQVTGDRLRLQFTRICISSSATGAVSNQPGAAPRAVPYVCDTELAPTQARDALTGMLRCQGLSMTLPLTLPLG